jgi:DNA-binding NtrC family response regulator
MLSSIAIAKSDIIVVVDDEFDIIELFSEALKFKGYEVISFTDPRLALEYIESNPNNCSLLITDYQMTGLNGCELGIKVKELNGKIKVILVSAYENIKDNNYNFEILSKPLQLQTLIKKINMYIK